MASSPDFVNYICEQLEGLGAVRSRKMFGEYMRSEERRVGKECRL